MSDAAPQTTPQTGPSRDAAVAVVRTLRDAGHTAYLAGGCVRDELLGLDPKDHDVATSARPDDVRSLFAHTSAVGASFGVVLIHRAPGSQAGAIEVATFREDGVYKDARRPTSVRFATAREDAHRRDFTINALFLDPFGDDPLADRDGVIDFVGGRADLARGVVRAVGEPADRLAEDHLRALRAVRFASRFGFELDGPTADAIRAHAAELSGVSRERIGDELRRMLAHPSRARSVALLAELGLDRPTLNEPDSLGARATVAALADDADMATALAAWAIDRHGEAAATDDAVRTACCARWRAALLLSNHERAGLNGTLATLGVLRRDWETVAVAGRKRLASSAWFSGASAILAARDAGAADGVRTAVAALAADGIGLAPAPLLDGNDLIEGGLTPGPVFSRVLDAVYDAQLEGRVGTKAAGMSMALELDGVWRV